MANKVEYKLTSHIDEVNAKVQQAIDIALEICGGKAESYAKQNAPVDTGNLQNSLTHTQIDKKSEAVGSNVKYAPYQELGTRKMSAANDGRGYLRPAIEDHMDEYEEIFNKELGKVK